MVSEGRLAKRLVDQPVCLWVFVPGQTADGACPDRRVFLAAQDALEMGQGVGLGLVCDVGDDLRAHLGVGLIG